MQLIKINLFCCIFSLTIDIKIVAHILVFQNMFPNGRSVNPSDEIFEVPCDQKCWVLHNVSADTNMPLLNELCGRS